MATVILILLAISFAEDIYFTHKNQKITNSILRELDKINHKVI